jgi:hypothetical protein
LHSSGSALRHLSQQAMMWHQSAHDVKKVPPNNYLYRARRGFRCRLGAQTCSVSANDLRSRMSMQLLRGALRAAVQQQTNNLATFQVAKNRAISTPFAPCPVVNSQNEWRLRGGRHSLPSHK